ncbi:hypothetical protein F5890DRAFT_596523 [Lentinula detonsa]|uniref:Uncharacterized protein n=1 Tax=Lentinula detonsa TaxID=2804962 RepID=A0AA38UV53_9AGAR|nr:hypothetical protein F5890DRAFT_596523 [Lentinula detonsa]
MQDTHSRAMGSLQVEYISVELLQCLTHTQSHLHIRLLSSFHQASLNICFSRSRIVACTFLKSPFFTTGSIRRFAGQLAAPAAFLCVRVSMMVESFEILFVWIGLETTASLNKRNISDSLKDVSMEESRLLYLSWWSVTKLKGWELVTSHQVVVFPLTISPAQILTFFVVDIFTNYMCN